MIQIFLRGLKKKWSFDENERSLLNKSLLQRGTQARDKKTTPPKIFIQTPSDYYILGLYSQVIRKFCKQDNYEIIGIWPNIFTLKQKFDFIHPFRIVYSIINTTLLNKKWMKLYRAIGIESFYFLDNISLSKKIAFFQKSLKIWKALRTKEDLIALSIDDLYCGDLIYDTYLRYRIKPTVFLSSPYLLYYIYKCHCVIESAEKLVKGATISHYFSSYSTYIQHGVPVRIFLKHGIQVYTSGNFQQRFKRLDILDHFHTATHRKYWQVFKTFDNQPEKISQGKQLLLNKFQGVIDKATGYMKKSAYQSPDVSDNTALNFDGVVFLHDFYDSPHIYSNMLFPDFYEWVEHTLKLIIDNNLNIGVKPHPNQVSDSKKDIDRLQKKYPSVKWIDPKTSNIRIIKSGIKFGVSIYGTILHELAFHGINPICAGDNPHASFSFIHFPHTVHEYDQLIVNFHNLALPADYEEQVSIFYYMHNVHPKEDFQVNENIFKNYNVTNGTSALVLSAVTDEG